MKQFSGTDGQVVKQIFSKLDRDNDSKLSMKEFVYIFEETENLLRLKISEDENNIRLTRQALRDGE